VPFRSQGEPILDVSSPNGISETDPERLGCAPQCQSERAKGRDHHPQAFTV